MKKEPNNCMYEGATMPSYFPCIKSSSWTATETTCRLPQTYLHVPARLRPCEEGRYGHREGTYRAEQRRCRRSYGYLRGLSILLSIRKYVTFNP